MNKPDTTRAGFSAPDAYHRITGFRGDPHRGPLTVEVGSFRSVADYDAGMEPYNRRPYLFRSGFGDVFAMPQVYAAIKADTNDPFFNDATDVP